MKRCFVVIALLIAISAIAKEPAKEPGLDASYPVGDGARYELQLAEGVEAELMLYVSESSENRVGVEMFLSTTQMGIPIKMWQQTLLERSGEKVAPVGAYLFTNSMKRPEVFDLAIATKKEGLQISDFLMLDKTMMDKYRVGEEDVSTPAGTVKATHYKQTRDKDTIEYWVSDAAKPIRLVKLVNSGKLGFTVKLGALVRNVKRQIDPATAGPVTSEGRQLLSLPTTLTLH